MALISTGISASPFSGKEDPKMLQLLNTVIEKYELDSRKRVLIVAINSSSCLNCLAELDRISKYADNQDLQVVYWLIGVRTKEVKPFFSKYLNLNSDTLNVCADDELLRPYNPNLGHLIIETYRDGSFATYAFADYGQEGVLIPVDFSKHVPKDSFHLKEDEFLIDNYSKFLFLDSSNMVTLDLKYSTLFVYDLEGEVIKKKFEPSYKTIRNWYKTLVSKDEHRNILKILKNNKDSLDRVFSIRYQNFDIYDNKVFVSLQLMSLDGEINNPSEWKWKTINAVVVLDRNFNILESYRFPGMVARDQMDPCYILSSETFTMINDKEFYGALHCGGPGQSKYHKYSKFVLDDRQVKVRKLEEFQLPQYFIDQNLYYNYNSTIIEFWDDRPIVNFNVLPEFYDLNGDSVFSTLQSVGFEKTSISLFDGSNNKFGYMRTSQNVGKNEAVYQMLSFMGAKEYSTLFEFDASGKELSRVEKPKLKNKFAPFVFYEGYLYYLYYDQNEDLYLYKVKQD